MKMPISCPYVPTSWVLVFGFMASVMPASATFDLDRMQVRAPQPPANHIGTVNYLNGRWIMGDVKGTISNSEDGSNWATVTTPYGKGIEDLTYYNGFYVASGADGRTLLLSIDLVNWESTRPLGYPNNPKNFLEAFGYLYVVGWSGSLSRTQDLVTWEEIETGEIDRAADIAFNGTTMVMVGAFGEILTSTDGVAWTVRQLDVPGVEGLPNSFLSVNWVVDQFIAGGKEGTLMTSPDGIDWSLVETPFEDWLYSLVRLDGELYFPGRNGQVLRTENLQDWEEIETGLSDTILDLHYNGGKMMAVGRDGGISISMNGTDWEVPIDETSRGYVRHLAYHDGRHLATTSASRVLLSNDTEAWLPVFDVPEEEQPAGLEHFLGEFTLISNRGRIYTSPDGEDWTELASLEGSPIGTRIIDDRLWVVGRRGLVASTDDLVTWTVSTAGDENLNDIARGPEGFVAIGQRGAFQWSEDGTSWGPIDLEETRTMNTAVYFNDQYFVFGFFNVLWKSSDGVQWTKLEGFPLPSNALNARIHDGSLVLPGYLGQVDVTTDGETWERFSLPTNHNLSDLIFTPTRTVVVGGEGTILSSPANVGPGFTAWQNLRFNVLQRLDPKISGPGADPDGDKQPNLLEYLSNTQPLIPDADPIVVLDFEIIEGERYPMLSYRRSVAATDVFVEVLSVDGDTWLAADSPDSPLGGIAEEQVSPFDAETDTVSLRFASGLSSLPDVLLRLRLSLVEGP